MSEPQPLISTPERFVSSQRLSQQERLTALFSDRPLHERYPRSFFSLQDTLMAGATSEDDAAEKLREGMEGFTQAVVERFREAFEHDEDHQDKAAEHLRAQYFGGSDSPLSLLSIEGHARLAAELLSIPPLARSLDGQITQELIEQLQGVEDLSDFLNSLFADASPVLQLQYIGLLERIQIRARGSADYASDMQFVVKNVLVQLQESPYPLVRLRAGSASETPLDVPPEPQKFSADLQPIVDGFGVTVAVKSSEKGHPQTFHSLVQDPSITPFGMADPPEQLAGLLQEIHHPRMRAAIKERYGFSLEDLTVREQVWLLQLMTNEQEATAFDFFLRDGIDRTAVAGMFFACSADTNMAMRLQSFLSETDVEAVNVIAEGYQHIARSVQEIESIAQDFFLKQERRVIDTREIVQQVVRRLNNTLEQAMNEEDATAFAQLERDTYMFSAVFRGIIKGNGKIEFERVRGLDFGYVSGEALSESQKEQMMTIAQINYADEPHVAEDLAALLGSSERRKHAQFIMLERHRMHAMDGSADLVDDIPSPQVISFVHVEPNGEGRVKAGKMNVIPSMRSFGFGEQMLLNVRDMLHRDYAIDAQVVPEIPVGTFYIEKLGFVATHFDADRQKTETKHGIFNIEIPKDMPSYVLRAEEYTREALLHMYEQYYSESNPETDTREQILCVWDMSNPEDVEELRTVSSKMLGEKEYVLSRNFCIDASCSKRLYGFERTIGAA